MEKAILAGLCALLLNAGAVHAQSAAFTYQGRLTSTTQPATGLYDFSFNLFAASSGGGTLAGSNGFVAVPVTNGLFTVALDFGLSPFTGSDRWLEIAVRTNGVGSYAVLSPRQPLMPTPYAVRAISAGTAATAATASNVTAGSIVGTSIATNAVDSGRITDGTIVNADINAAAAIADTKLATISTAGKVANTATTASSSNAPNTIVARNSGGNFSAGTIDADFFVGTIYAAYLNGVVPSASISGIYSNVLTLNNPANSFAGSGAGLVGLNASQLNSGTVSSARLSGTYASALTLNNAANSFSGSGANLTALNASQLASGTVPDGRLAGNVARRDQANTFTGAQTITNGGQVPLRVQGNDNGGTWVDLANASAGGRTWNFISSGSGNSEGPGKLLLRDSAQGVLMTLSTNGNVGIGTTTPAERLDVAGTVKADAFAGNWEEVTGTAQQAAPNRGYLANHAAQVTITLPHAPAVGDVVRVTGVGMGGWKIAQNSGQVIRHWGIRERGAVWIPRESARSWNAVASSADGTKLVACVGGGQIYTSTDSGVNWTPRDSNRNWLDVASSADGIKLVACVAGGRIYTSTDSGVNWTPRNSNNAWRAVASSADGTKLVACVGGGQIYTSTDSGVNWTPRDSNRSWTSVASSADGTKLIAAVAAGGLGTGWPYTSTDSGLSWTPGMQLGEILGVASSADGQKLFAVGLSMATHTSTNSGANWTPRDSGPTRGAASSADGSKLVACTLGGSIHVSNDSGVNWTTRENTRDWFDVASSADGSKLVAVHFGGQIYTSDANSTLGVNGGLAGGQDAAVELQHVGGGVWRALSLQGTITPF